MLLNEKSIVKRVWNFKRIAVLLALLLCVASPAMRSQDRNDMPGMPGMTDEEMKNMPGMEHMDHMHMRTTPETPAEEAARLADQHGSEFNHHVAGFLLILAGLIVLMEDPLGKRLPLLRYVWPMCFLIAGVLMLIFSDPEMWPVGPQSWSYAFAHSTEDIQHKCFAVILLILGYVELQRARGRFTGLWTGFVFPVVALAGTILLLFHVHGGPMTDAGAMERMDHIKHEHAGFAATGFGIALTKGLAVIPMKAQPIFRKIWPALLIVLGCMLIVYTE